MDIDVPWLVTVLATSALGFVYISYGRRMGELWFALCGAALLSFGYFVSTLWGMILIAIVLAVLPFLLR